MCIICKLAVISSHSLIYIYSHESNHSFEATNDDIVAFPKGLQMLAGDATRLTPVDTEHNLDPSKGPVTAASWTCPRKSFDPPSWPVGSDGTTAGIGYSDGEGFGFPLRNCDGLYSPLRADIHFPSCSDPTKALDDFKHSMSYPIAADGGKQDCPAGHLHVPHLFYEVYWDTQSFADRWTPDGKTQPFVLSNGDVTGYSLHADFFAGWNEDTLQTIIDTCDAGSSGMQNCPQLPEGLNSDNECTIPNPIDGEVVDGVLKALPGNNPLKGYQYGKPAAPAAQAPTSGGTTLVTVTTATPSTTTTLSTTTTMTPSTTTTTTPSSTVTTTPTKTDAADPVMTCKSSRAKRAAKRAARRAAKRAKRAKRAQREM